MSQNWSSAKVESGALRVTPFQTNGIFHKVMYNKVRITHCTYIEGSQVLINSKSIVFLFLKIHSADPDEMLCGISFGPSFFA